MDTPFPVSVLITTMLCLDRLPVHGAVDICRQGGDVRLHTFYKTGEHLCCKEIRCGPGEEVDPCDPNDPYSIRCRPCPENHYQPDFTSSVDMVSCHVKQSCREGMKVEYDRSPVRDRECICDVGQGRCNSSKTRTLFCQQRSCGPGMELNPNCSCSECATGFFKDTNDSARCIPWKDCETEGKTVKTKGSTTTDSTCGPVHRLSVLVASTSTLKPLTNDGNQTSPNPNPNGTDESQNATWIGIGIAILLMICVGLIVSCVVLNKRDHKWLRCFKRLRPKQSKLLPPHDRNDQSVPFAIIVPQHNDDPAARKMEEIEALMRNCAQFPVENSQPQNEEPESINFNLKEDDCGDACQSSLCSTNASLHLDCNRSSQRKAQSREPGHLPRVAESPLSDGQNPGGQIDVNHDVANTNEQATIQENGASNCHRLPRENHSTGNNVTSRWKEKLNSCRVFIIENLVINAKFLSLLMINRILSEDTVEPIDTTRTRSGQIEKLLNLLLKRPDYAFQTFIFALVYTDQHHIAMKIDKDLTQEFIEYLQLPNSDPTEKLLSFSSSKNS